MTAPSDFCTLCAAPLVPIDRGSSKHMPIYWCPTCDLAGEPARPVRRFVVMDVDGMWRED